MIYREHQSLGRNDRGEVMQGPGEIVIRFNGVEAEAVKLRVHQMLGELEQLGYQIKNDRLPQLIREALRESRRSDQISESTE